jgi:antitoxin component YwqK of YwqJK toxin-antitoxin module
MTFSFILVAQIDATKAANLTDANGLKQGHWQGLHSNGNIRYSGSFKNDQPIGVFNYYDNYGNLSTVIDNSTDSADVVFYHLNKVKMAEGKYYNQQLRNVLKMEKKTAQLESITKTAELLEIM